MDSQLGDSWRGWTIYWFFYLLIYNHPLYRKYGFGIGIGARDGCNFTNLTSKRRKGGDATDCLPRLLHQALLWSRDDALVGR
jgi:hypothetical protein